MYGTSICIGSKAEFQSSRKTSQMTDNMNSSTDLSFDKLLTETKDRNK